VPDEPLISSGDVARRLGVTTRTVSRWVREGVLTPAFTTPGNKFRFRWSEVVDQLREYGEQNRDED
jgi:excisionase family DNA binding protein